MTNVYVGVGLAPPEPSNMKICRLRAKMPEDRLLFLGLPRARLSENPPQPKKQMKASKKQITPVNHKTPNYGMTHRSRINATARCTHQGDLGISVRFHINAVRRGQHPVSCKHHKQPLAKVSKNGKKRTDRPLPRASW
jgi:hypothetical protein